MIKVRKNNERGFNDWGWLKTNYTFSFADYYDPNYMGYSKLRVLNEDRVDGGRGFDAHPHKDMEILTYVLSGSLIHKDSLGNSSVIKAGELQKMSAGRGVVHSEYNASQEDPLHFLQIWIIPNEMGLKPEYDQIALDKQKINGNIALVASGKQSKNENILRIHQDAEVMLGIINEGNSISKKFGKERKLWLQMINGNIKISGYNINSGDGASIEYVEEIDIVANENSEFLIFNMN